jgi:hypothetical protein
MAKQLSGKEKYRQTMANKKAEQQRLAGKFPHAVLIGRMNNVDGSESGAVSLILEQGQPNHIEVRKHGKWHSSFPPGKFEWITIFNELESMGNFIHALVCRYNALVEYANDKSSQAAMKTMTPISAPDDRPRRRQN